MEHKGHHYITESYQKNFINEKGQVWILTPEGKIYSTNPKNSFKEGQFYLVKLPNGKGSLIVEKTLSEIEGAFINTIRSKIEKDQLLTEEDRGFISIFVASMITRTKVQREHFRESKMDLLHRMREMETAFKNNQNIIPTIEHTSSGPSFTLNELEKHMEEFNSDESFSTLALLEDTAPMLYEMKWTILIAPSDKVFISSDNPFCMCSPEREKRFGIGSFGASAGILNGDIEITFPLTKKRALFASWKNDLPFYMEADQETIKQINYRTARTATNLFASSKEELENILKIADNSKKINTR